MERFNLVFSGKICEPLTPETMAPVLVDLGFSDEHIALANSGKPLTVKRDLLLARAQLVKLSLAARGLVTEMTVALDPDGLAAGLRYIHRGQQAFPNLEIIHPKLAQPIFAACSGVYGLQQRRVCPLSGPAANDAQCHSGTNSTRYLGSITQLGTHITLAGRICLSLLLALPLLGYLQNLAQHLLGDTLLSTILSLTALCLLIGVLPALLRPLSMRSIHVSNGPIDIHVVDQWGWGLIQNSYSVYDYRINKLANIVAKRKSVILSEPYGRIRFKWDANANLQGAEAVLSIITDNAFANTESINSPTSVGAALDKSFRFFRSKHCIERVRFGQEHAHIVTDNAGRVAAIIYRNSMSVGIAIHEDFKDQSQQLRAMAVVFSDGSFML